MQLSTLLQFNILLYLTYILNQLEKSQLQGLQVKLVVWQIKLVRSFKYSLLADYTLLLISIQV